MGKRILNLYMDDDLIELARARGMNMSESFRNYLKIHLDLEEMKEDKTTEELIAHLKKINVELTNTVSEKMNEIESMNKRIKLMEEKLAKKPEKKSRVIARGTYISPQERRKSFWDD